MVDVYQILVRLLDDSTYYIHLPSTSLSGVALKLHLHALTRIPLESQFFLFGSHVIHDDTLIHASDGSFSSSCSLLHRLWGGKGCFNSLVRGATTKARKKRTDNLDVCRDLSGRRLEHVNVERSSGRRRLRRGSSRRRKRNS